MINVRNFSKKYFNNLSYFYAELRYRLFLLLLLSVLVGIMDGFGLAMFLPMLEMVSNENGTATASKMGNLSFIVDIIGSFGYSITLGVVLLTIILFFCIKGAFVLLNAYLNVVYQQYFIRRIREANILALACYQFEKFMIADAGRIQNTMSGEVSRVSNAYRYYLQMMQEVFMILTYAILAFLSNPQFAAFVFVGGILTNILFNKFYKKTKAFSRQHTKSNHDFQGLLIQQVSYFKYLKSTGLIRCYAQKLKDKVVEIENLQKQIGIITSLISGIREPILICVVAVVILIQVQFMNGSLGLIILSILFFYRALQLVMQFQISYNAFLGLTGSVENLKGFTKELNAGVEKTGKQVFRFFRKSVLLRNVKVSSGGFDMINNVSIEITKNEVLALVGGSGSGKTTLLNVICGLLTPSRGSISVDGICFRDLELATFQKRIGYITQEPVIFDDTIFNNVTFWDLPNEQNRQRFYEALQKANISEFVQALEAKEDTVLGNNGINLSGGQRQRLSIARELYKDVDLLLMDEATSALDSDTERVIQENIDRLRGNYTIIIVAHRLSTIRNADHVLLLKNGEIEDFGSYGDLIRRSESFQRMVELQRV